MTNNFPDFRNPQEAFENALDKKVLIEFGVNELPFPIPHNDVGSWMYMHSDKTKKIDYFKNKLTRKYIEVAYV